MKKFKIGSKKVGLDFPSYFIADIAANHDGDLNKAIDGFRPPIFWKDKDIVKKQIDTWSSKDVYKLLNEVTFLEIKFKKNYELSNNLIFDFILNTSANS